MINVINIIRRHPDDWDFFPQLLDESDPRPAADQINERYVGGWNSRMRFGVTCEPGTMTLRYTDDRAGEVTISPMSVMTFRHETLALFQSHYVVIMQPDESWDIARLD